MKLGTDSLIQDPDPPMYKGDNLQNKTRGEPQGRHSDA